LIDAAVPLPVAEVPLVPMLLSVQGQTFPGEPQGQCRGWMLSLADNWFACKTTTFSRSMRFEDAVEAIQPGMSGSPIMNDDGTAIGVVCLSVEGTKEGGPNPVLSASLPGWFLRLISPPDQKPR
jgi:hypothetical protein